jgi:hypothetical protein
MPSTSEITADVLVVGAGLAGTMVARMLSSHSKILVVDQRKTPDTRNHWALLRFRDLEVARALGVTVREIEVEKAVYWRGSLHYTPNITMNNLYSIKAYGSIGNRSLRSIGVAKRYLPTSTPQPTDCLWGAKLVSINKKVAKFAYEDGTTFLVRYGVCVSTIPMAALIDSLELITNEMPMPSHAIMSEPITVMRLELGRSLMSTVNQTIYFPENRFHTYRATLEGSTLIVEAIGDESKDSILEEYEEICSVFGLPSTLSNLTSFRKIGDENFHVQPIGKINEMDDEIRRDIIYQLTDHYSIYSVGRFATWRPIRADQLVKDVQKVERMIRQGEKKTKYERRLNCV